MTSLNAIEAISKIDPVDEDAKVTETDMNKESSVLTFYLSQYRHIMF